MPPQQRNSIEMSAPCDWKPWRAVTRNLLLNSPLDVLASQSRAASVLDAVTDLSPRVRGLPGPDD